MKKFNQISLECLEDRYTPATAVLSGGVLGISAEINSTANDVINVTQLQNQLVVSDQNGFVGAFNLDEVAIMIIGGGEGNDVITLDSSVTKTALIFGGEGNDTITGGSAGDYISGDNGNDVLIGGGGYDYLRGGTGFDALVGHVGHDEGEGIYLVEVMIIGQ